MCWWESRRNPLAWEMGTKGDVQWEQCSTSVYGHLRSCPCCVHWDSMENTQPTQTNAHRRRPKPFGAQPLLAGVKPDLLKTVALTRRARSHQPQPPAQGRVMPAVTSRLQQHFQAARHHDIHSTLSQAPGQAAGGLRCRQAFRLVHCTQADAYFTPQQ